MYDAEAWNDVKRKRRASKNSAEFGSMMSGSAKSVKLLNGQQTIEETMLKSTVTVASDNGNRNNHNGESPHSSDIQQTILQEIRAVKSGQETIRRTLESKIDKLRNDLNASIDAKLKAFKQDVDLEFGRIDKRIDMIENKCAEPESAQNPLQNNDLCVIVFGLPADRLNPEEAVIGMLGAMGVANVVDLVACKSLDSKNAHDRRPPLIKCAFRSLEEKVAVLRAKKYLKDTERYNRVYVRSSKSHVERLIDINFNTILKSMPNGRLYRVSGSGRLIRNDANTAGEQ